MTDHGSTDETQTTDQSGPARTQRRKWRIVVALVFVAGVIGGLVIGFSTQSDDDNQTLSWMEFKGGLQEATLTVPIDHSKPEGETLTLRILRRPADDPTKRIGSLLVNPGGPGFGAESMMMGAKEFFEPEILSRFDIVGMDPRGTGLSTPAIDCIDNYDEFIAVVDISPQDSEAREKERESTKSFAENCVERVGDAIAHMTTAATARDLDMLRRALGEDTITYFGTSYGCTLGATWATLFPNTVRAAVLDGCEDPTADEIESARQQAIGFQRSVEAFLQKCESVGDKCPIGKDRKPIEDLRELWNRAASGELTGMPGRPSVNEWVFQTAIIVSMYSEDYWPALAEGLAAGLQGDGSILMQLSDAYYQRRTDGTWGNELEATLVISCMDNAKRTTTQESEALNAELPKIAPLIYPQGTFSTPICDALPAAGDSPITITGSSAPPLLVIGNTGDPATPFASTKKMAAALQSSILVAVESNNHGGYGINDCINDAVHGYLIDSVIPEDETTC
jgi:pimeloyl-ACP methyl ester carboxylesterase